MLFKKTEELKVGMRLARPIYNKTGVLLYERNSQLTTQGIISIKNFGLIGIFILEPAEPVPPMTKADIEFERFQTMCVFSITEELEKISATKKASKMQIIVANIIKNYGHLERKINFVQNLRSNEDYIFKHTMNVAILVAMLSNKMNLKLEERNDAVMAALVHDIGKLSLPVEAFAKEDLETYEVTLIRNAMLAGYTYLDDTFPANPGVKRICIQFQKLLDNAEGRNQLKAEDKIVMGAKILLVAETFDTMTAMRYGKPPASEVLAIKHLIDDPKVYDKNIVAALIDSINILSPGVSVELNNGDKALVLSENTNNILRPMLLNFRDNMVIDLSNTFANGDLEIVDIMKTMDNRHILDMDSLRKQGILVEEPEFVKAKGE